MFNTVDRRKKPPIIKIVLIMCVVLAISNLLFAHLLVKEIRRNTGCSDITLDRLGDTSVTTADKTVIVTALADIVKDKAKLEVENRLLKEKMSDEDNELRLQKLELKYVAPSAKFVRGIPKEDYNKLSNEQKLEFLGSPVGDD